MIDFPYSFFYNVIESSTKHSKIGIMLYGLLDLQDKPRISSLFLGSCNDDQNGFS
jgi:hypothetical protein